MGAMFEVNVEHPLEQPGPTDMRWDGGVGCLGLIRRGRVCFGRAAPDNGGTELSVGC
jgi:hypothetical protein